MSRRAVGPALHHPNRLALTIIAVLLLSLAGLASFRLWMAQHRNVTFDHASPVEAGFDAMALKALAGRMMGERHSEAFVIARHGRIVVERYAGSWRPVPPTARRRLVASMGKGLVGGTVMALGICEGWLDPEARISRYLPGWGMDARRDAVTIRALATHTAGLANVPHEHAADDPDWRRDYWSRDDRRAVMALHATPFVAEPNREVRYSNPGYTIYSVVLAKAADAAGRGSDIARLFASRVLSPLGVPPDAVTMNYGRSFHAEGTAYREVGSGARMTARAMVRLGEMVAGHGSWHGHRVVERSCLDEALKPNLTAKHAGDDKADLPAPAPAAGWWSNANGAWPELPADLLVAAGAEHRVLVVVPSLDLVAVRLGPRFGRSDFNGDFWSQLRTVLLQPLLATLP